MADEGQQRFWNAFRSILEQKESPEGSYQSLYEDLVKEAKDRPISYEEFYYLLGRYAFLDIHHPNGFQSIEGRKPTIIKAKSQWFIQDYDDRIRTGPSRLMYGSYLDGGDESGKGPGHVVKGVGTLVQQMVDTAEEVMALAQKKGWKGAKVYSGFYGMIRAAWIVSKNIGFELTGFEYTVNDEVVRHWVESLLSKRVERLKHLNKG